MAARPIFHAQFGALSNGIIISDGPLWERQRKLMQPAFHAQKIYTYAEVMTTYTARTISAWQADSTVDVSDQMMRLTLEIFLKAVLDVDTGPEFETFFTSLYQVLERVDKRVNAALVTPTWLPTPANLRERSATKAIEDIVLPIIRARRANSEDRGDLLSMLVQATDEDGTPMSEQQLRDEMVTLFFSGHDTTANSVTWLLYNLAKHPDAQQRIVDELNDYVGERLPTVADLQSLAYLTACVRESMRMYPSVYMFGRSVEAPVEIGGQTLPVGSGVLVSIYAVHRHPDFYPEPDTFKPERWPSVTAQDLSRYAFVPFGGGPHVCIGNSFAWMEIRLIAATILQRFKLSVPQGFTPVPVSKVTMHPKDGMPLIISAR